MDRKEYISNLKNTELRPKKVKVEESKEKILLEQDKGESDIHAEIIKYFLGHPNPTEDDIDKLAEEMGIDDDELQNHIYMILSSILTEGYSKGKDVDHDPKELEMGIEVEYEHTTEALISRKIAMDHLVEIPDYYTRLKKMEDEAKAEKAKK